MTSEAPPSHPATTSYGACAETVAGALRELLTSDMLPTSEAEVHDLLALREAVVDALRQRLSVIAPPPSAGPRASRDNARLSSLVNADQEFSVLLYEVVDNMPRLTPEEKDSRSPSDLLGPRRLNRTVELWRRTAVDLLAGSLALELADEQAWASTRGSRWFVLRDAAVALEAVTVLDHRLKQVGLLNQHDGHASTTSVDRQRLFAAHVTRVGTWNATSSAPDDAVVHLPRDPWLDSHGRSGIVHLVSTPADLVRAQRRLARFVRPLFARDLSTDPPISADTARQIYSSQLFLCGVLREQAISCPRAEALAEDFAEREASLLQVVPRLRYLVDVHPYHADLHIRHQQGEITSAVSGWMRDKTLVNFTAEQLLDLNNTSHEVTRLTSLAIRREARRPGSNLAVRHPLHHDRLTVVRRRSDIDIALTDLCNAPAPSTPVLDFLVPLQRAALKQMLDLTPTESRPAISTTLSAPPTY